MTTIQKSAISYQKSSPPNYGVAEVWVGEPDEAGFVVVVGEFERIHRGLFGCPEQEEVTQPFAFHPGEVVGCLQAVQQYVDLIGRQGLFEAE